MRLTPARLPPRASPSRSTKQKGNCFTNGVNGSGEVAVDASAQLTAGHLIVGSLVIGGTPQDPAVVTITASDENGNSLADASAAAGAASGSPAAVADVQITAQASGGGGVNRVSSSRSAGHADSVRPIEPRLVDTVMGNFFAPRSTAVSALNIARTTGSSSLASSGGLSSASQSSSDIAATIARRQIGPSVVVTPTRGADIDAVRDLVFAEATKSSISDGLLSRSLADQLGLADGLEAS